MTTSTARRGLSWLAVTGLLAGAIAGPAAGTAAAAPLSGAIWTSLADGSSVNANHYTAKEDVYLNGGPQNCGGSNGLPNGDYYFQVTDPSGATLLSSDAIKFRQISVVNEVIHGVSGEGNHAVGSTGCSGAIPVQLIPYADTPNNGNVYSVDIAPKAEVEACEGFDAGSATFNFLDCKTASKNDNFKVEGEEVPPPPPPSPADPATIQVVKVLDVDGDLQTTDDQSVAAGWAFGVSVTGGTPSDDSITTAGSPASASVDVTVDEGTAAVTLTEVQQEGFDIVGASCTSGESHLGSLQGLALSLDVAPETSYVCTFYNTSGEVEGVTGTPRPTVVPQAGVTPPPTDIAPSESASGGMSQIAALSLIAIATGLLALIPRPAPKPVRRTRR